MYADGCFVSNVIYVFFYLYKTNDKCAIPQQLKDEVSERYPGARRALIKSGGDFPFLSRPDEINLHLKVHMYYILLFSYINRM